MILLRAGIVPTRQARRSVTSHGQVVPTRKWAEAALGKQATERLLQVINEGRSTSFGPMVPMKTATGVSFV